MQIPVRSAHVAVLAIAAVLGSAAQSTPEGELRILVLEGEGSLNNIREHTAHAPIVRVVDAKEQPVAGATVNFLVPDLGASGYFPEGRTTLTTTTDNDGRAVARGFKPNNVAGRFQVRVSASSAGRTASIAISQINVAPATVHKKSNAKYVILVLAAGGAAGAALGLKGGSKSSSSSQTTGSTGTTITPGSPVFGPPR